MNKIKSKKEMRKMSVRSQLVGLAFCVAVTGVSVYEGIHNFNKELDAYNKKGVGELMSLEYKIYCAEVNAKKTMGEEAFVTLSELNRKYAEAVKDKLVVAAKKEYESRSNVVNWCIFGALVGLVAASGTYSSLRCNC